MQIPSEYFDEFYAPLVGSQEAVDDFGNVLAERVRAVPVDDEQGAVGAYDALRVKANEVIGETVKAVFADGTSADKTYIDKFKEARWRRSIEANGRSGARFAIDAMHSLGALYVEFSDVPQHETGVRRNAHRVLGDVLGIAFQDKLIGTINLEAYNRGLDPRSILTSPVLAAAILLNVRSKTTFDKAYEVSEDDAGQLLFRPRFRKLGRIFDRQCPAAHSKVDVAGNNVLALSTFVRTIGNVAVDEIFPRQFSIVQE